MLGADEVVALTAAFALDFFSSVDGLVIEFVAWGLLVPPLIKSAVDFGEFEFYFSFSSE